MTITAISRDWGESPAIVRITSTNTLAQVGTTGYVLAQDANIVALNSGAFEWLASDMVLVVASDGWGFFTISSDFESLDAFVFVPGVTLPTVVGNLAEFDSVGGNLADSGVATTNLALLDALASTQIWVGSGAGIATPRTVTGDVTIGNTGVTAIAAGAIVNADVNAAAAIDFSKLAALTDGHLLVGSALNVATDVALSGDATLVNSGAITLGAVVNAAKGATYVPEDVIAGMPVLHVFSMVGGATATRTIATAQKITVVDAWVVNKGLGTVGDTITVKNNAGTAITDAMDISGADKTIARAGTIDDAQRVVNAGDNLQSTETDGGGNDSPACDVYVMAYVTP